MVRSSPPLGLEFSTSVYFQLPDVKFCRAVFHASQLLHLLGGWGLHSIANLLTADMAQPVAERIKKLRDEIAEINQANLVYLHGPKYGSAVADHERRFQRLLEIVNELKSLTDWKKL